jgi:hypothetical protein
MKNSTFVMVGAAALTLGLGSSAVQAGDGSAWGMVKGDWEFTMGGGGTSNKDFDATSASANFSIGYFLSDRFELALRQNVGYTNAEEAGDAFAGQTRLALDYHLKLGEKFFPYFGVNAGGIYGDGVNESWTAGLEAGMKYYVLPKTFLFGHFEWAWAFESSDEFDDAFDDGAFVYAIGIGFNF